MPYLFSLLGTEAAIAGSKHRLCCYTNDTANSQMIREINEAECLFVQIVFSGERVLFAALPGSTLEIHSPFSDTVSLRRVDCDRLCLHEVSREAQAAIGAKVALQTCTQSKTEQDARTHAR